MYKLRQRVDSSPSYCRVHADEVVQVHFGVSSFNAGVLWRGLSPVPTRVLHVRPVRSKVLQVGVSTNHSEFPPKLWMNVIIRLKGIFYVNVERAGKWQNSIKVINEALSFP